MNPWLGRCAKGVAEVTDATRDGGDGGVRIVCGDCRDVMRGMDAASVDSIVTDPPYGLSFMGKGWDHGVPGVEFWVEALRVAKPGAHLLAFGGTRTFHRLACAIEDAGWEIRDTVMWVYGSGFPKSLDVSKAIDKAAGAERTEVVGTRHRTVKPTALMRYLCRLVTPPNGTILDPFMGSGSTGKAAVLEGFSFIGADKEQEYCDIAKARIEAASTTPSHSRHNSRLHTPQPAPHDSGNEPGEAPLPPRDMTHGPD
jgi:DNA modification methylase